jgi:hypothetical protein
MGQTELRNDGVLGSPTSAFMCSPKFAKKVVINSSFGGCTRSHRLLPFTQTPHRGA